MVLAVSILRMERSNLPKEYFRIVDIGHPNNGDKWSLAMFRTEPLPIMTDRISMGWITGKDVATSHSEMPSLEGGASTVARRVADRDELAHCRWSLTIVESCPGVGLFCRPPGPRQRLLREEARAWQLGVKILRRVALTSGSISSPNRCPFSVQSFRHPQTVPFGDPLATRHHSLLNPHFPDGSVVCPNETSRLCDLKYQGLRLRARASFCRCPLSTVSRQTWLRQQSA